MKVSDVFLVFLAICGIQARTVLQELTSNPQYSIFLGWLSKETKGNLNDSAVSITVFIPRDTAAQKFLETHPTRADNINWLGSIAEHCVVHGNFDLDQLKEKQSVVTGEDFPKLWISVKDGHIYINSANVTSSIGASNGHVHELDAVIYPLGYLSTLKEEIDFDEDYSGLNSLIANATEVGDLLDDATGKFTVFSPNPKAVTDNIKAMNHTQLLPVIQRHLIKDQVLFSSLLIGQSAPLPTLGKSEMINVQVMDNIVFVGSGIYWSMVESADVSTSNGVIHVIDGVLGVSSGVNAYQALGIFHSSKFRKTISEFTVLKKDLKDKSKMFTVFSPQNAAWDNVSTLNITIMEKVLKRHVLSGLLTADELMKKTEVVTLTGETLAVKNDNGSVSFMARINALKYQSTKGQDNVKPALDKVDVRFIIVYLEFDNIKAAVTSTDNMASNGIIHIIDKVLILTDSSSTSIACISETGKIVSTSTGCSETKETLSTSDYTFVYVGVGLGLVVFVLLGLIVLLRKRMSWFRSRRRPVEIAMSQCEVDALNT